MGIEQTGSALHPLFAAAQQAFRERRLEQAVSLARQVASELPGHVPARILLANLAHLSGRPKMAEQFLREALSLDPQSLEALIGLSALLADEGDPAEAATLCELAMTMRPGLGAPHFHLGRCLLRQGRYAEAAASFQRAAAFTPNLASVHHHWGIALQQLGRSANAADCFRRSIALDSKAALSNAELGNILLANGEVQGAISCFRRSAELQPDTAQGLLLLSRALVEEEKLAEAEECLTAAIAKDAALTGAYLLFGRLLYQRGRFAEAEAHLNKALTLDPNRADIYCVIVAGKTISSADRPLVDAMVALVEDGHLPPAELRPLHYMLGKAHEDLAEYRQAMLHFEAANRISRDQLALAGRLFDRARRKSVIDATIAQFSASHIDRCKELGVQSDKPIFIVGMPRSGTTLLEQILSSHPDIGAAGEFGNWVDLTAGPFQSSREVPAPEAAATVANDFLGRLEQAAPGSRMVTEKTPQNYLVLGAISSVFPNAHIIHMKRHPVDTCLSIYTTAFMSGPEYAHDLSDLVFAHKQYARLMAHWRSVLPANRLLEINYEDLVANREAVTRRILEFLNLEWSEACLHHEKNEHAISTPSVWQARQPIFSRSVGRWRKFEPWLGPLHEMLERGARNPKAK